MNVQTKMPPEAARRARARLERALLTDGRDDLAESLQIETRDEYIYIAESDGGPVCRLKYLGDPDRWALQLYRWSDERYAEDADPAGRSPEECILAAIDDYRL